jgi:hypothetical protein
MDQEVMEGILKRFEESSQQEQSEVEEGSDGIDPSVVRVSPIQGAQKCSAERRSVCTDE